MGKGKGRGPTPNDQRSRSMNPQDSVGRAAMTNAARQETPDTAPHQAVLDNRSVQLNKPKTTTEGCSEASKD
jgi:hypothetical protein